MKKTLYFKITDLQKDREKILRAAKLLAEGELVAFPTETVYGLGGNALDPEAVEAIYEAKGRPLDNPMIVHIAREEDLYRVCREIPPFARALAACFWPGPLTLVLPASSRIPPVVTGGLATVAVRIPDHPVALDLLEAAGVPVAAPSANLSGRPSPTRGEHVLEDLEGRIAALVDAGPCRVGVESTVLDVTRDPPRILRPGGVTLEELRQVLPRVELLWESPLADGETPSSPGMKYRHYAPRAPLYLLEGDREAVRREITRLCREYSRQGIKVGLLTASPWRAGGPCLALDLGGWADAGTAAARLFDALRQMDASRVGVILAEGIPREGLGAAVMNRLRKAAGRNILWCGEKNISREIFGEHTSSVQDKNALEEETMRKTVLLVCTGNTCRSVMAQGILQHILDDLGEGASLRVISAGVAAALGGEATEEALMVLAERGIELDWHRSRPVSDDLLAGAYRVLTMTGSQRDIIHRLYPWTGGKVFSLKEFVGETGDIEDPIGMPQVQYRKTARKLERLLLKAVKKMLQDLEE